MVITDLMMPEQEGIATIQQIKRESPPTPVIAMSGGSKHVGVYLQLARKLGASATLAKPFSWEDLEEVIGTVAPNG